MSTLIRQIQLLEAQLEKSIPEIFTADFIKREVHLISLQSRGAPSRENVPHLLAKRCITETANHTRTFTQGFKLVFNKLVELVEIAGAIASLTNRLG